MIYLSQLLVSDLASHFQSAHKLQVVLVLEAVAQCITKIPKTKSLYEYSFKHHTNWQSTGFKSQLQEGL